MHLLDLRIMYRITIWFLTALSALPFFNFNTTEITQKVITTDINDYYVEIIEFDSYIKNNEVLQGEDEVISYRLGSLYKMNSTEETEEKLPDEIKVLYLSAFGGLDIGLPDLYLSGESIMYEIPIKSSNDGTSVTQIYLFSTSNFKGSEDLGNGLYRSTTAV